MGGRGRGGGGYLFICLSLVFSNGWRVSFGRVDSAARAFRRRWLGFCRATSGLSCCCRAGAWSFCGWPPHLAPLRAGRAGRAGSAWGFSGSKQTGLINSRSPSSAPFDPLLFFLREGFFLLKQTTTPAWIASCESLFAMNLTPKTSNGD